MPPRPPIQVPPLGKPWTVPLLPVPDRLVISRSPSWQPDPMDRAWMSLIPLWALTQGSAYSAPPHTARASPETAAPAGRG